MGAKKNGSFRRRYMFVIVHVRYISWSINSSDLLQTRKQIITHMTDKVLCFVTDLYIMVTSQWQKNNAFINYVISWLQLLHF